VPSFLWLLAFISPNCVALPKSAEASVLDDRKPLGKRRERDFFPSILPTFCIGLLSQPCCALRFVVQDQVGGEKRQLSESHKFT
jgi:hypothetical protein